VGERIYRSDEPDIEIPDVSLSEYVMGGAAARGDHPAIIDTATGETTTYGELAARVDEVAAAVQVRGVEKGDIVALVGANGAAWAICYQAILRAGGVVTPINPVLTPEEMAKQMRESGARLTIDDPPLMVEDAQRGARPTAVDVDPGDLAVLPYSSGTTGLMKGVMLSNRNLVANIEQAWTSMPLGEDDTLVGLLPFFHSYGQTVVLNLGLAKGSTIVTMPRFDLDELLRIVEEHRVTWLHIVPPIVLALATSPKLDERDTSSLKMVISGAAPLDADLLQRAEERIGAPIRQGYGLTEVSPVSHKSRLADVAETPPGSVGPLIPNTEARLVDSETGEDVPEGEEGEIWIRGPQVMLGYLNNPEATAATITEDGWLRSGDIGRRDENGYFFVVDRLKELIKYHGYQVPPAELEALLLTHPDVQDAAVIGVADADGEETPKAFVVPRGELDPAALMAWVADRVAPHKKIRQVAFVDAIPKSSSGKILRKDLRARV
jgi:acyl-CoA synthetase (AMP-forming)/AMP-acid ligase II